MTLSGLPFFVSVFEYLLRSPLPGINLEEWEGRKFCKSDKAEIKFELPFDVALTGERIALNLIQRSSAISTYTSQFVEKAAVKGVKILDTRKTTPGLRFLEKYAVRVGGGHNHRLGQADVWMIKDNHKKVFGGLEKAWAFFEDMQSFYNPVVVEIHDLQELEKALELGCTHMMLDNFSPEEVTSAVELKRPGVTYEVSGGINLSSLESYLLPGVDAISVGSITYGAPPVDLSFKFDI